MLSSSNNIDKFAKSRKKDIVALKISATCADLIKMFPVRGKEASLSLRTSSILVHGLTITIRLKAQMLRDDLNKMLTAGKRPVLGEELASKPERGVGGVTLNFDVDLDFGEVDRQLQLSEEELNARYKAVTMTEVDALPLPTMRDDWSLNSLEQEDQMSRMLVPDMVDRVSPPVKPRHGSDHRMEVTDFLDVREPELQDPPPFPPLTDTITTEDVDALAPPQSDLPTDDIPDVVIQPPVDVSTLPEANLNNESVIQPPMESAAVDEANLNESVIQPPADHAAVNDFPAADNHNDLVLNDPQPIAAKPKRPGKRKAIRVVLDEETQISKDDQRAGLTNYADLLRAGDSRLDIIPVKRHNKRQVMAGRKMGTRLYDVLKYGAQDCTEAEGWYDWDDIPTEQHGHDVDLPIIEDNPHPVDVSVPQLNPVPEDVSVEDVSGLREENSGLRQSEANLSFNPPLDSTRNSMLQPKPSIVIEDTADNVNVNPFPGIVLEDVPEGAPAVTIEDQQIPDYDTFAEGLNRPDVPAAQLDVSQPGEESGDTDNQVVSFIQEVKSKIAPSSETTYGEIVVPRTNRKKAAQTLLSLLVANKLELAEVDQTDCYGEIGIKFDI